ncbi:MAG: ABC transporter permease [Actinobacteria bacterium]|nr:MAG: ABC transporter permease [Actinomycetota bacterium]
MPLRHGGDESGRGLRRPCGGRSPVRGFGAFLRKELVEIGRTWRIFVLPGLLLLMGLMSPVVAQLTPRLVESLAQSQPGAVIEIPEAGALDAYLQWTKNLTQIVLIALIIVAGGLVSSERQSGTAVIVLTKPLSRSAFVLAKALSQALLLAAFTAVGALVCWLLTLAVFGEAPVTALANSTLLWLLLAIMFVGLMVLLSVAVNSQAGAAGIGLVGYLSLSILSAWGAGRDYTPAGLLSGMNAVITGDKADLFMPLVTTVALVVLFLFAAVAVFRRQEL